MSSHPSILTKDVPMPVVPEVLSATTGNKRYRPQNRYLLTRAEAADYIGVSISALAHWPAMRRGPRQCVIGRSSYYHISDLDAWIDNRPSRRGED